MAAAKGNGSVGNATEAEFPNDVVARVYECEATTKEIMKKRLFSALIEGGDTLSFGVEEDAPKRIEVIKLEGQSGGCTTGFGGCSLDQEKEKEKLRQAVEVATPPPVGPTLTAESVGRNIGFGRPLQTVTSEDDYVYVKT